MSSSIGDPIVFCGGAYVGKTGWLDATKVSSASGRVAVIVNLGHGLFKSAKVESGNFRRASFKPSNYAEACLYEHDNLNVKMKALCAHYAKCGITKDNVCNIKSLVATQMFTAIEKHDMKGNKANCLKVAYKRREKKHSRSCSASETQNTMAKAASASSGSKSKSKLLLSSKNSSKIATMDY